MAAGRTGGHASKPDPLDSRPYTSLIVYNPANPTLQRKISFLLDTGAQVNVITPMTSHEKTSKTIMVQGLNATAATAKVKFWVVSHNKPLEAVLGGINILGIPGIKALQLKEQTLQALPLCC